MNQQPLLIVDEAAELPAPNKVREILVRQHVRHTQETIVARKKKKPKRPKETMEQRFEKFHRRNPKVLVRLAEMALAVKKKGVSCYGIKALYEVLRYEAITTVQTDAEPFKLNNNYTAYYARAIEQQYPELKGFFKMRVTKS